METTKTLADNPEQPEGDASEQDLDLDAQLDHLLGDLEEAEPQLVPADLRKNPPEEPAEAEVAEEPETPTESQAEAQTESEAEQPQPEPVPVEAPTPAPISEQGLDAETIAAMAEDLLTAQIDSTIDSASTQAPTEQPDTQAAQPEPQPIETEPQPVPIQALSDKDLAGQLDTLLNEVQNPGAAASEPTAQAQADESPAVVNETPAEEASVTEMPDVEAQAAQIAEAVTEPTESKSAKALSEDDLANQIQNLLNDVQNPGAAASEPTAQTQADEAPAPVSEPAEPTPVAAEAASTSDEDAGAVSIDQIDEMLAESASQAIEHGPEPEADIPPGTDEVLAAQDVAEQEAKARSQPAPDSAEPQPIPAETPTEAESQPEPVPMPVQAESAEPQPVAEEPTPEAVVSQGASAADVASELDNDPQSVTQSDDELTEAAFAEILQGEQPIADPDTAEVVINQSRLKMAERALLMICSKVNKPLNNLSSEMRDSIGYAGVVTTGLAVFMLLYGVIF